MVVQGEESTTRGIQLAIINATRTPKDCLQLGFRLNGYYKTPEVKK